MGGAYVNSGSNSIAHKGDGVTSLASDVIYWSGMKKLLLASLLGVGMLVPSLAPVLADTLQPATLIKGSGPAVYWYSGVDSRRYVFPNTDTFYSWFPPSQLARVNVMTDAEVAAIRLGGTMTYRPSTRLLKISTDPKVYVVERGTVLRWLETESVAAAMYGSRWSLFVDTVPDAFFVGYSVGASITTPSDFSPVATFTPDDVVRVSH